MSKKMLSSTDRVAFSSSGDLKNTFSSKFFAELPLEFKRLKEHGGSGMYDKKGGSPRSTTLMAFVHKEKNEVRPLGRMLVF